MGDESEPITAVAKAVEETAKTGRALVEAGSDLAMPGRLSDRLSRAVAAFSS